MRTEEEIKEEHEAYQLQYKEADDRIKDLRPADTGYSDFGFYASYSAVKKALPKELQKEFDLLIAFYNKSGCAAALEWVLKKPYENKITQQELPYDLFVQLQNYNGMNCHDFNGCIGNLRYYVRDGRKEKVRETLLKMKKMKPSLVWSDNWIESLKEKK